MLCFDDKYFHINIIKFRLDKQYSFDMFTIQILATSPNANANSVARVITAVYIFGTRTFTIQTNGCG